MCWSKASLWYHTRRLEFTWVIEFIFFLNHSKCSYLNQAVGRLNFWAFLFHIIDYIGIEETKVDFQNLALIYLPLMKNESRWVENWRPSHHPCNWDSRKLSVESLLLFHFLHPSSLIIHSWSSDDNKLLGIQFLCIDLCFTKRNLLNMWISLIGILFLIVILLKCLSMVTNGLETAKRMLLHMFSKQALPSLAMFHLMFFYAHYYFLLVIFTCANLMCRVGFGLWWLLSQLHNASS